MTKSNEMKKNQLDKVNGGVSILAKEEKLALLDEDRILIMTDHGVSLAQRPQRPGQRRTLF